jgi:hypothetical protein
MRRSTYGLCQGDRGAVLTSSIPKVWARLENTCPGQKPYWPDLLDSPTAGEEAGACADGVGRMPSRATQELRRRQAVRSSRPQIVVGGRDQWVAGPRDQAARR